MSRTDLAAGYCDHCEKLSYLSKADAKKIARRHTTEHKSAYRCDFDQRLWHVGSLPLKVLRGEKTRGEYYHRAA